MPSDLPIPDEIQNRLLTINAPLANELSNFVQRQENTEAEVPHPSSLGADLLKLLNLPPETPVVGLNSAATQPGSDLLSPVQVSTNNHDSEISRSVLDSSDDPHLSKPSPTC